jgi:hypothetical protein
MTTIKLHLAYNTTQGRRGWTSKHKGIMTDGASICIVKVLVWLLNSVKKSLIKVIMLQRLEILFFSAIESPISSILELRRIS